jgi:hypothetical protein
MSAIKTIGPMIMPEPNIEDLGPAMKVLTDRQRRFVIAWCHTGNRELSAKLAGYAGEIGEIKLDVGAYRAWHSPKVQEAIREHSRNTLASFLPAAAQAIQQGLELGEVKDRAALAVKIFERSGLGFNQMMEHKVTHVDESREDMIRELISIAKRRGLDPQELIGNAGKFIEAEVTEVDEWMSEP